MGAPAHHSPRWDCASMLGLNPDRGGLDSLPAPAIAAYLARTANAKRLSSPHDRVCRKSFAHKRLEYLAAAQSPIRCLRCLRCRDLRDPPPEFGNETGGSSRGGPTRRTFAGISDNVLAKSGM